MACHGGITRGMVSCAIFGLPTLAGIELKPMNKNIVLSQWGLGWVLGTELKPLTRIVLTVKIMRIIKGMFENLKKILLAFTFMCNN